jgi:hypothetical protein
MTAQNALLRIMMDTPLKSVENKWQYKTELEVLQKAIDDYNRLLEGMKLLSQLDQMNLKVLLQAKQ